MAKMMMFYMPDDPALLAAIGRVAIRHGQLHHILRMAVKSVAGVTVEEAIDATERQTFADIARRARRLAKQRLGEGPALVKLDALLERFRRANRRRNDLLHSLWAQELDGDPQMRTQGPSWAPIPKAVDLDALAVEMEQLTLEMNQARLEGWLRDALSKSPAAPGK